jgi:hypothetical protein
LREAEALGLISIERRRRTAWVNFPNLIQILSKEWHSWLRLRTGANSYSPRLLESKSSLAQKRENIVSGSIFQQRHHQEKPEKGFRHSRGG